MDNRDPRAHGRIPGPDGVLTTHEGRREQVRVSVATNFRPDLIEGIKSELVFVFKHYGRAMRRLEVPA